MEREPITASIMAPSQETSLRNTSNSDSQDSESFEIVDPPVVSNAVNTVALEDSRENDDDDYTDCANESTGEGSDMCSDSDESDIERGNDNDDNTPSQRLSSFLFNFRVMYIGQNVPDSCKARIVFKISESLSQSFWDEMEGDTSTNDIGLEKRLVIFPVSNVPGSGKPQIECYQDSGVSICEADLTNGSFSKASEYLQKTFAKIDPVSNLVDLCIVFVPQNVEHFPNELLLTMRKLQEKVTLLPIIIPEDLTFKDEMEEKRQAIINLVQDNGIKIFIWKADKMVENKKRNGEFNFNGELISDDELVSNDEFISNDSSKWEATVFTKKVLTVDEFVSFDNQHIYEDLQLLRSRAIEFRKDRFNRERAKKRAQKCDKLASIFRDIIIMCMILYTVYLFVTGVWHYAEWSVIPPELASSLQIVSESLKTQHQNVLQTIPLDNGETQPFIEVSQESSSRFNFNILNKKQYNDFEVIVTHNPPQILGRYDVQGLGNGRYVFDIDTTGSKGEVLVEIKEKNGSSIKTVPWVPKEDKTKIHAIKVKEEPSILKFAQSKAVDAYQNAASYFIYVYEETIVFGANVLDEIHGRANYFGNQLSVFNDFVWNYINHLMPIIREKISNLTAFAKESIEGGYLNTKEFIEKGYLKTKKGSLNFVQFIKDQYYEIYASF